MIDGRKILALLLFASISLPLGCNKKQREAPEPVPIAEPGPGATGQPATGMTAIRPKGNALISEAQVRDYVSSHPMPGALRTTDANIQSINFMTSQQLRPTLHSANLGLADDAPVCLVILNGKFEFPGPPGQTPTFSIGVEVFDARTGNLLQHGGLLHPPQMTPQ